ncbi:MAG: sugar phosphate isomerase/epimerase [Spirochaetales bacterium]|nr:sugar phosphate isomerase/epimerase [Spirochaetales bacterium]
MNNEYGQLHKSKSLKIGVISPLKERDTFLEARKFGLSFCQVVNWNAGLWGKVSPAYLRKEADSLGITVSSFWVGYPGQVEWNFTEGPSTIGIVPRQFREERKAVLIKGAEFASKYGAKAIVTHAGFIPENCRDPLYKETVETIEEVGRVCQKSEIQFWFETGQETPITLLRLIEDTQLSNLGINLDPANLIMYGKANPVDALDTIGKYVRSVHVKDGLYPTKGDSLGPEVKPGYGKVNFHKLIGRLKEFNFDGEYIIEREISGPEQENDIRETIAFLKSI